MQYSEPIRILVAEHDVIMSVIEAVEVVAQRSENDFPVEFYEQAFDFFPVFADKCHHAKEETHLFPALEAKGFSRESGPVHCMLHEHDEGRAHVAAVRQALQQIRNGDPAARAAVQQHALAYARLLRDHIAKENQVLFVMADHVLSEAEKKELLQRFDCAEHSVLPAGSHEKYVALAGKLREYAGLSSTSEAGCCHAASKAHACQHA
ncbi:MAG TPA: hemerythrin domain-containing protein [Phycisphaerae bacterium]|nr:hemerythrin domain-containing protein [Phycisphaerae bacterium]HNU44495.1 hemerythrin domain-containing protein [Phycisphaerae bacterium]